MSLTNQPVDRSFVFRIWIVGSILLISSFFILKKLHSVQTDPILAAKMQREIKSICWVEHTEVASRGRILDFRGHVLATDWPYYDVYGWKPKLFYSKSNELELRKTLIYDWNKVFGEEIDVLQQRMNKPKNQVLIKRYINPSIKDAISELKNYEKGEEFNSAVPNFKKLKNPEKLLKLDYERSYKRHYPNPSLMTHVIGFQVEVEGKRGQRTGTGVEWIYDAYLKPQREGLVRYLSQATGEKIYSEENNYLQAQSGHDVYLTLHEPLQSFAEQQVKEMVEKFHCKTGVALMADPKTGAILASCQYPEFDLNKLSDGNPEDLISGVLYGPFEPGSIMKGLSIGGALDLGVVSLNTYVNCENGFWYYGGASLKDSGHRYGVLSVEEVVQKSSNIGTAKITLMMGDRRLYGVLRKFGFGEVTDAGMGQEAKGIFRPLGKWDKLSVTRFPMGQGLAATPIQVVQGYCALANGGEMIQLRAVDRIYDPNEDRMMILQPTVKRRVISSSAAAKIMQALCRVTERGGTGTNAAIEGVLVAGKTGTAQKWDMDIRQYSHSKYHASFVGVVPADDPRFVLIVVADEPKGKHYGGEVAAPYFKKISEFTLSYLQTLGAK